MKRESSPRKKTTKSFPIAVQVGDGWSAETWSKPQPLLYSKPSSEWDAADLFKVAGLMAALACKKTRRKPTYESLHIHFAPAPGGAQFSVAQAHGAWARASKLSVPVSAIGGLLSVADSNNVGWLSFEVAAAVPPDLETVRKQQLELAAFLDRMRASIIIPPPTTKGRSRNHSRPVIHLIRDDREGA